MSLTDEEWEEVDKALFDHAPLLAVKLIRQFVAGLTLHEAGAIMHARYKKLRQQEPGKFTSSDEDYWVGWYS